MDVFQPLIFNIVCFLLQSLAPPCLLTLFVLFLFPALTNISVPPLYSDPRFNACTVDGLADTNCTFQLLLKHAKKSPKVEISACFLTLQVSHIEEGFLKCVPVNFSAMLDGPEWTRFG